MNVADFRSQLEEELDWRTKEILFFQNQCATLEDKGKKEKFRRALILILYSHFEGYCKFGLTLYLSVINKENIDCKDANYAIAAASLSDLFVSLRDGTNKAPEFKNDAPDDTKLHLFAREREFIERTSDFLGRKVFIPDKVVDTESNLKPIVLRKNLYKLGLPHNRFSSIEPDIDMLLNLRNNIAHGATKDGIPERRYEQLRESAFRIMKTISIELTEAVSEKWYQKITSSSEGECPLGVI